MCKANTSRTHAVYTTELTNGMTVDRILKTSTVIRRTKTIVTLNKNEATGQTDGPGKNKGTRYESNCLITDNDKLTPSSEILVTIPRDKGSKKYKTFLGLIDIGSSSSLLRKAVVENTSFTIEQTSKKTLWDTQAGSFKTNSFVLLERYFLPQFTTQRKITNTFHLFDKLKEDGYDVIIGRDILKDMGLQIHYDMESFV
jgi:hypothetical protein